MQEGLATIAAAGLAAFVSLMVVIITKEQKVSEFRQQWVDSLRADAAEYMAATMSYHTDIRLQKDKTFKTLFPENRQELTRIQNLEQRLLLRLNTKKKAHQDLEEALHKIDVALGHSRDEPLDTCEILTPLVRVILKQEWERVKQGELMHRAALYTLSLATIVSFAIFGWVAWRDWGSALLTGT